VRRMFETLIRVAGSTLDLLTDSVWDEKCSRLQLEVGDTGVDRWGMSPEVFRRVLGLANWLHVNYFRVRTEGIENVPAGRVLLIGNHSGQVAWDGLMVIVSMVREGNPPRAVRSMAEKFLIRQTWLGTLCVRMGQVTGLPENGRRLLEEENAVMVFPEGARGVSKPWFQRYHLQRFGTGFLRLALETNTPIVPFAFVGGEEMMINLGNLPSLARILKFPSFPILLTPLPLPSKCSLRFGEPLHFQGTGEETDAEVQAMVEQVRGSIESMIEDGLAARKSIFFG
jgi:1-acyl-sn-glycerol-3-phosphate acyltransferase